MKKFFFIYASVFACIWTGYGLYAVITSQPHANTVLIYGLAYSAFIFATSWFCYWLMGHYKRIDKMAEETLSNIKKDRRAE